MPPVSHAPDILLSPKSSLPRYAAYLRARHRFWDAFPAGQYTRLATPGTNLECGLYALILSMRHQHPAGAVRIPTVGELRAVFRSLSMAGVVGSGVGVGDAEGGWFTADQLAAVFSEWGRRFLGGEGKRAQMGWVMDPDGEGEEGWPVMMNTPDVETGEVGDGIVRVWVWNDGMSLKGGVGHFEGVRRPTGREAREMDGTGVGDGEGDGKGEE